MKYKGFEVFAKHMIDSEWRALIHGTLDGEVVTWSIGMNGGFNSRKEVYAGARLYIDKQLGGTP